ncbi:MAG: response regulator [Spirochaetaceae bacterium]|nr:response regulator [Spirochaetaceae bacterium]MBP5329281.1 response regulator [Spirochaetaceae bacterium]
MKDILIIREENNVDKSIFEFLKCKYEATTIDFDSKNAEFIMASQEIPLVIAFIKDISASSIVELRRIIVYLKNAHICLLGSHFDYEKFTDLIERENLYCIDLPKPVNAFQKAFDEVLRQNDELNVLLKGKANRKHSILLVDDDPICLRTMTSWLHNFYEVAVAKSGAACISFLGKTKPELILLDYEMPVCDGLQTLEMIRSEPDYADIPVVFLTGVSDSEKVMEALKLKPQGYILKNTDRIEFLNKVNAIFEKQADKA